MTGRRRRWRRPAVAARRVWPPAVRVSMARSGRLRAGTTRPRPRVAGPGVAGVWSGASLGADFACRSGWT